MQKKIVALLLAGIMLVSVLGGCGGKTPSQGTVDNKAQGTAAGKKEPPVEINWLLRFDSNQPCPDDDPVKKKIEELGNAKLNIQWVPGNTWNDKLDIIMASGDLPDLFSIGMNSANFVNLAGKGAFWDLKPYVNQKDYPNLYNLHPDAWTLTAIKGKNYGVPSTSFGNIGGEGFPQIREDWLKKLDLKVPETMDQVYEVMKAFTEKDPDGNGKKDTIGLTGYVEVEWMGNFGWVEGVFNHSHGGWKVEGDKLVGTLNLPGTRKALEWLSKAYQEGLIPQDFAVIKSSQMKDYALKGKAGIYPETLANGWRASSELRKAGAADATFKAVTHLISGEGKKYAPMNMNSELLVISKKVPEAKMKRILQYLDWSRTPEARLLGKYGLEGQHYKMENGQPVPTVEEKDLKSVNLDRITGIYDKYSRAFNAGIPNDLYEWNKKVIDERLKIVVSDPGALLVSATAAKVGRDMAKKTQDLKTQIIMGKQPISAWDEYVNKLKNDPDSIQIEKEINEAYKAMKSK